MLFYSREKDDLQKRTHGVQIFGKTGTTDMKQERVRLWKNIIALAVVSAVVGVVQVEFFGRFGWGFVPDLAFATLMCVSFYLGRETGAALGIGLGVLMEALTRADGVHILPTVYLFCGFLCGQAARGRFTERSFVNYLLVVAASMPVHAGVTVLQLALRYGNVRVEGLFTRLLLPEAAALAAAMILLYFPLKQLCRWLKM